MAIKFRDLNFNYGISLPMNHTFSFQASDEGRIGNLIAPEDANN